MEPINHVVRYKLSFTENGKNLLFHIIVQCVGVLCNVQVHCAMSKCVM